MNYQTEKHQFEVGDLVFHDADAKKEAMLIKIVGLNFDGYICTYVYHDEYLKKRLGWRERKFLNAGKFLHDASLWGIDKNTYKKIEGVGANYFAHMDNLHIKKIEVALG